MGWMIQLAMGVAFWILPRFRRGAPRGEERWSWLALVLVNAGICLVGMNALVSSEVFTLLGRASEILGLIAFMIGNWRRVKAFDT